MLLYPILVTGAGAGVHARTYARTHDDYFLTTNATALPSRLGDALPSRLGDALPSRLGDALPSRLGDALPSRLGDALPSNYFLAVRK